MDDDEVARRKGITFEQAEGVHRLPSQLARTEVTAELRAVIWGYIYGLIETNARWQNGRHVLGEAWDRLLKDVHVFRDHRPIDEFSSRFSDAIRRPKTVFEQGSYSDIYGWLQFILQNKPPAGFAQRIESILRHCRSSYRIVDDVICPLGSEEDVQAVRQGLTDATAAGLTGSREHLRMAAVQLSAGNFADSVRESIHAVESAVRILEPSGDFSKALGKLEQRTSIHSAMKKGFLALYGFSSDEQGIRHPLLDKEASVVEEADALFMIGACSAFVSYLINKSRAGGLLA
ncbi:AbiJ-NTD4 domain-containing protein [Bradyrhizobium yuanmingense]|uniref:AbiJ-NTD4 domain-containing protein n=1 Tax=Bradyrhizobium yuanmingense TaxID=108015 RepID=UPI0023B91AC9|nr:hypothetical protein [Bradyrhizobium yuanmingense]MDF0581602.1 hypothetical protein [Bradyrhizobium yuanmingense]